MALLRWALLGLGLSACGGAILEPPDRPPVPPLTARETAKKFDVALGELAAHDRAGDWTPATCTALAADFERIARGSQGDAKDNAWFNAGISYQRCGQHPAAEKAFRESGSHRARAELILYRHAAGASLDATIVDLQRVIREGAFQNVRALVALAALQMERGAEADLKAAHQNLQRALAIDDAYAPAANQLALYYLSQAKADAGADASELVLSALERPHAKRQQVDLAALVISQALKKNDNYAPLHNTAGLVQVELSDYRTAVHSFARARELDPSFFEAHMNFAALSFAIRGFARAESAYRDAIGLRPNDYDAHLGLSLAIRAQAHLTDRARIAEARKELAAARKLDPRRPEAYYNEAVLVQEYDAKAAPGKRAIPELRRAQKLYGEFAERAEKVRALDEAVKRARERSADIEATIKFLEQGS